MKKVKDNRFLKILEVLIFKRYGWKRSCNISYRLEWYHMSKINQSNMSSNINSNISNNKTYNEYVVEFRGVYKTPHNQKTEINNLDLNRKYIWIDEELNIQFFGTCVLYGIDENNALSKLPKEIKDYLGSDRDRKDQPYLSYRNHIKKEFDKNNLTIYYNLLKRTGREFDKEKEKAHKYFNAIPEFFNYEGIPQMNPSYNPKHYSYNKSQVSRFLTRFCIAESSEELLYYYQWFNRRLDRMEEKSPGIKNAVLYYVNNFMEEQLKKINDRILINEHLMLKSVDNKNSNEITNSDIINIIITLRAFEYKVIDRRPEGFSVSYGDKSFFYKRIEKAQMTQDDLIKIHKEIVNTYIKFRTDVENRLSLQGIDVYRLIID